MTTVKAFIAELILFDMAERYTLIASVIISLYVSTMSICLVRNSCAVSKRFLAFSVTQAAWAFLRLKIRPLSYHRTLLKLTILAFAKSTIFLYSFLSTVIKKSSANAMVIG